VAAFANRVQAFAASRGVGLKHVVVLHVRGRRTGKLRTFPVVVVADDEGERYLVAMLGEKTNWLRNINAAAGNAVLRHGRREPVRLEMVEPGSRAEIVRSYLQVAPGARPHIPVDQHAPPAELERIAARYPVFRVCNWVQNVRAADGRAVLRRWRAVTCRLAEVPVAERPAIVRRYLEKVPGGRPHIPVSPAPRGPILRLSRRATRCSGSSRWMGDSLAGGGGPPQDPSRQRPITEVREEQHRSAERSLMDRPSIGSSPYRTDAGGSTVRWWKHVDEDLGQDFWP
jgi:deazaflavin-dependent oxidoreductase (nitroreductase family)